MKKFIIVSLIVLASIGLLLAAVWFLPRPVGPWKNQPASTGYVGAFEKNNALDQLSYLDLYGYTHPETVLVRDGWIYASVKDGVLLRMREDGGAQEVLLDTGGCLLGFDFDAAGNILIADCNYGGSGALLRVAPGGSAAPEVLLNRSAGFPLCYPNDVAVASDGTVYLSDSTAVFSPAKFGNSSSAAAAEETMMHTCSGRVIAFHPDTGKAEVIAGGFAFANGLALSADEKSLFVSETYANAIRRIDLASHEVTPFLDNLPGFCDNVSKGLDGRYWVGLNGARSDALDAISDKPFVRKIAWILSKLSPAAEDPAAGYCHVFAFAEDGTITESLQSGANGYYRSTGAAETPARLYIESINDSGRLAYIARGE